jgi:hypothetical protein
MLSLSPAVKLWYCPDPVDRRLGFDGLYALVCNRLKADPLSGHLFLFRNRLADRLKVLYWGGHGLCLSLLSSHFLDRGPGYASRLRVSWRTARTLLELHIVLVLRVALSVVTGGELGPPLIPQFIV